MTASFAIVQFWSARGERKLDELRRQGRGNVEQDRMASEAGREREDPEPENEEESDTDTGGEPIEMTLGIAQVNRSDGCESSRFVDVL